MIQKYVEKKTKLKNYQFFGPLEISVFTLFLFLDAEFDAKEKVPRRGKNFWLKHEAETILI